jgi:hypothetical protein
MHRVSHGPWCATIGGTVACLRTASRTAPDERHPMSKRARKRRSRKGNKANHGRKPNA